MKHQFGICRPWPSDQRGLSLVEMLVAVAIFAVVALAISGQTLFAARQNRVSETQAIATTVAQNVLECLRLQRLAGLVNLNCTTTNVPVGYTVTVTTTNPSPPGFQWNVQVSWTRPTPAGSVSVISQAR